MVISHFAHVVRSFRTALAPLTWSSPIPQNFHAYHGERACIDELSFQPTGGAVLAVFTFFGLPAEVFSDPPEEFPGPLGTVVMDGLFGFTLQSSNVPNVAVYSIPDHPGSPLQITSYSGFGAAIVHSYAWFS